MKDCFRLIETRINGLIARVRGALPRLVRGCVINIITIDVHSRDVVDKFCVKKI